jgi:hypothetical protein
MKKLLWAVFLIGISCSSVLRVYYDRDRDFDLRKCQSYQWAAQADIEAHNNPLFYNELNDKRIKKTVDAQLSSKGFVAVTQSPEIILHYHIIVDEKASVIPDPYGLYGPYWTRPGAQVYAYQEGTLILDVMDAKTKSLAWRGWAVPVVEDDGQIREEILANAITKILEQFPTSLRKNNMRPAEVLE